ncbi:unnamed protein product, partial [Heterosigma akashiwo]
INFAITTAVQGGMIEVQNLAMATESGYVDGEIFRLAYQDNDGNYDATPCLEWGISAEDLEDALGALSSLTHRNLSITANLTGVGAQGTSTLPLSFGQRAWGHLQAGDVVRIAGSLNPDEEFEIFEVADGGRQLNITSVLYLSSGGNGSEVGLTKILSKAVSVDRNGTGDSILEIQELVITATDTLYPNEEGEGGYYKLLWEHGDDTVLTPCIPIDATAVEMEAALNTLQLDLNGDGSINEDDQNHISVSRTGDGTAESGYGYTYRFKFTGRAGTTEVLGSQSELEIVWLGSRDGCSDLAGPSSTMSFKVNTTHGSPYLLPDSDVSGKLFPGDRVRVGGSSDPWRQYTVEYTNGTGVFKLEEDFSCAGSCGENRAVYTISGGVPSLAMRTVVDGSPSYSYRISFVHPEISAVNLLTLADEGDNCSSWTQYGGMSRDIAVETAEEGGSGEIALLDLGSTTEFGLPVGNFFKLGFAHGSTENGSTAYHLLDCVPWNATDSDLEIILENLELSATVTRGTDDTDAPNGYVYTIYFDAQEGGRGVGDPGTSAGLNVSYAGCSTSFETSNGETVVLETLAEARTTGGIYTTTRLPLADVNDATSPAYFLGGNRSMALPVYRISGFLNTIRFRTNLGDLSSVEVKKDQLDGTDKVAVVFDPAIVEGELPLSEVIDGLKTGLYYYFHVAALNYYGYSEFSETTSDKPATYPDPVEDPLPEVAMHVDEVQSVTVAATKMEEVQVITSRTESIVEVQRVETGANAGLTVSGDFTLRFPEIQQVQLTSSEALLNGSFVL